MLRPVRRLAFGGEESLEQRGGVTFRDAAVGFGAVVAGRLGENARAVHENVPGCKITA